MLLAPETVAKRLVMPGLVLVIWTWLLSKGGCTGGFVSVDSTPTLVEDQVTGPTLFVMSWLLLYAIAW